MYLFNFTYQRDCRIVSRTPFVKSSMFWKVIFILPASLKGNKQTNKKVWQKSIIANIVDLRY